MRRAQRLLTRTSTPPTNRVPAGVGVADQQRPWFEITNLAEAGVAEIKLRGYIGMPTTGRDWCTGELVATGGAGTLQEFEAALEGLGQVKKIQLSIFSEGGDVFTGMAIHNLLVRHPAKKVCVIDGVCASAATYPALACHEIRIPSNAWMMIHGCEGFVGGRAKDIRSYAGMLDQMDTTLVNLYATRTGKSAEDITAMIEAETWMNGKTATENGFADTVIEPLQNLAARAGTLQVTNLAALSKAPAEVLALFDMSRITNATTAPLPMLKPNTPLFNAATDTPAAGGGAAPAQPAAAAPVAAAPPAPAVAPPAPAASSTPTNTAPPVAPQMVVMTQEQFSSAISNAVQSGITSFIQNQGALAAHNVSPQTLGGAQPVPSVVPTTQGEPKAPVNLNALSPLQLINMARKGPATLPPPVVAAAV